MMVHVNTVGQTFLNYTNAANADRVGLLVLNDLSCSTISFFSWNLKQQCDKNARLN